MVRDSLICMMDPDFSDLKKLRIIDHKLKRLVISTQLNSIHITHMEHHSSWFAKKIKLHGFNFFSDVFCFTLKVCPNSSYLQFLFLFSPVFSALPS